MYFGCLNFGQFAVAGHATRGRRGSSHDLLLQVRIEVRVGGLDGDARFRGVSRVHLETALAHRLQRLILLLPEEALRAILHQDHAGAAIARFAPHHQRRFLRHHSVMQVRSALFRIDGALLDCDPEFVRR